MSIRLSPRPINRPDTRGHAALAPQQCGAVGFLDLYQRTTSPRTDACRDEPKEGVMFRCGKTLIALALLMANPVAVSAQTADNPPAPSSTPQPATQSPPSAELLKPEQLEALVAPIALYPDELLANVLAASTYPLEVVQADRWLKAEQDLEGRCVEEGGREAILGQQRQGAREHRRRHCDDERQGRLDQEPGRCRARAAAGCDGRDPAPAFHGL